MEYVSKALIMAGGVLISIMVASFMIFVLRKAGSMSAEYDTQMSNNELTKFNSQFEVYNKSDNNFFDVLTVANLAYDINKQVGYDTQTGVTVRIYTGETVKYSILPHEIEKNCFFEGENTNKVVYIYNSENDSDSIIDKYTARTDDNSDYKYNFVCKGISYNDITGKVNGIDFKLVENN